MPHKHAYPLRKRFLDLSVAGALPFLGYNPCVKTTCVLQNWKVHELACSACTEAGKKCLFR
jgi:hypothetical protein